MNVHLLIVPSYFPNEVTYLTGSFFLEQAYALHKAGHQVGVIVPPWLKVTLARIRQRRLAPLMRLTREQEFTDFPVYRMHWGAFPRILPVIAAPLALVAAEWALKQYIAQHGKPDILHGHDVFYGGYISAMLGIKHRIPSVLTEHSTRYMEGKVILPGQRPILRQALRQSRSVICVSQALLESLRDFLPNLEGIVIPNLIDTDYFSLASSRNGNPCTFFAIGSAEPRKRFDLLVEAFHAAFRSDPKAKLKIAGEGSETSLIKAQVTALGLDNQVDLLGRLSREQVRKVMQDSHVLVSSSQIETFGISLIEALACGKPIISTASGGANDIVTPDVGLLVPVDDLEALTNALKQMLDQHATYDPQKLRQICITRYSEYAVVAELERVYDRVSHSVLHM